MNNKELVETVIKHDVEFKSLSASLSRIVDELHNITSSMKSVDVIISELNAIKASAEKTDETLVKVSDKLNNFDVRATELDTLNRAVFGKDGRGGLIYDLEDMKKFKYKLGGAVIMLNALLGVAVAYYAN